jgi:hypothetical protein
MKYENVDMSYDDWRAHGFQVKAGERMAYRSAQTGKAMFRYDQVKSKYAPDEDWEDAEYMADIFGINPWGSDY